MKASRTIWGIDNEDYEAFQADHPFRKQVFPNVFYSCAALEDYLKSEWDVVSNEQMVGRINSGTATDVTWTEIVFFESYAIGTDWLLRLETHQ